MGIRVPNRVAEEIAALPEPLEQHRGLVLHAARRLFEDAAQITSTGGIYVSTGDIPAMWLRDSSFQIKPLIRFAADPEVYRFCAGVIKQQANYIAIDPYANAFNPEPNSNCWHKDFEDQSPWVFERKWEIDSLASFLDISAELASIGGITEHLDEKWLLALDRILETFEAEQDHDTESYRFVRAKAPVHDYLSHGGFGAPFKRGTGLIWSGFRPSDDACELPFNIPQNAYAAASLAKIFPHLDGSRRAEATSLATRITDGIERFGSNESGYLYEVDGLGGELFMDDANVPSLLSLPYLGFCTAEDSLYARTRSAILSERNPWFFSGKLVSHIGSPHTGKGRVWPLAMAIDTLTSGDAELEKLSLLASTVSPDGSFHESVAVDDLRSITRPWFSWAEMTYFDAVFTAASKLSVD